MKLDSLHALYIEQLHDIYNAETLLGTVLPYFREVVHHPELKQVLNAHSAQTDAQMRRIETILARYHENHVVRESKGMAGLIEETNDFLRNTRIDPDVLDAGLIAAAQRVMHYEIAGYGTVCTYAEEMGYLEDLQLLRESLAEEKQTDHQLSVLAELHINVRANI